MRVALFGAADQSAWIFGTISSRKSRARETLIEADSIAMVEADNRQTPLRVEPGAFLEDKKHASLNSAWPVQSLRQGIRPLFCVNQAEKEKERKAKKAIDRGRFSSPLPSPGRGVVGQDPFRSFPSPEPGSADAAGGHNKQSEASAIPTPRALTPAAAVGLQAPRSPTVQHCGIAGDPRREEDVAFCRFRTEVRGGGGEIRSEVGRACRWR